MTVVVCVAGLLGLAGCTTERGGSAAEAADTAVGTSAAVSTSPAPASPVPVTGPEQKLVTMTVTGGYAGVRQEVVLRGDGTVRAGDKGDTVVRRAGAAEFTEVRTLLGDPALDGVSDFSRPAG